MLNLEDEEGSDFKVLVEASKTSLPNMKSISILNAPNESDTLLKFLINSIPQMFHYFSFSGLSRKHPLNSKFYMDGFINVLNKKFLNISLEACHFSTPLFETFIRAAHKAKEIDLLYCTLDLDEEPDFSGPTYKTKI